MANDQSVTFKASTLAQLRSILMADFSATSEHDSKTVDILL